MEKNYIPVQEMTFREASAELETIVRKVEGNTMELEETLEAYKRGVELIASLKSRLDSAEQEVAVLVGQLSGQQDDDVRDTTLS